MKTSVKIEGQAEFRRQLKRYSKAIGQSVEDSLIEYGIRGGRQLASVTEPRGLGKKARVMLDGSIAKDVHKVYMSAPQTYNKLAAINRRKAAAFLKAVEADDMPAAQAIVRSVLSHETGVDGGELLKSERTGRKGHVRKNNKAASAFDYAKVQALKKKEFETKGGAKGAWFSATKDLRGSHKGTPKWLRKERSLGEGRVVRRGDKTQVILTNNVRYIKNVLTAPKVRNALMANTKFFKNRMTKQIEKANNR